MPAEPIEPEKYSIDEMMERLQGKSPNGENPDSELVTRADGTKAVRVRKRKRRSSQSKKEATTINRRMRVIQLSVVIGVLILLGLSFIGITLYANSAPYRENLIRKIGASAGADASLNQLRVNPSGANADAATFTWPEGNVLKSLQLTQISAKISPISFFGKSWSGEEITAKKGQLVIGGPVIGSPNRVGEKPNGTLPVNFDRYEVSNFDATMGNPKAPSLEITSSEASFYPKNVSGRTELRLNRGKLSLKGWPTFRLHRALVEFRGSEAEIISMRIFDEIDDRGTFELSGTLHPFAPDQSATLALKLDSFLLDALTGTGLREFFAGRVNSREVADSNYLTFIPTASESASLNVAFTSSTNAPIEVSNLPFLQLFSQAFADEWFKRPVFETTGSGIFRRENGINQLSELNLESKTRMAIQGDLQTTADGKLTGTLKVGVAEAIVAASPAPRLAGMFTPTINGFRWINITVSGTASDPVDDFKTLYDAAADKSAGQSPAPPTDGKLPSFEELTRPR